MERDQGDIRQISAPGIFEKVIEILSAQSSLDGKRFLDAPAGEGAFAQTLLRLDLGLELSCGDLNPEQFKLPDVACAKVDLNRTLPYPDRCFDVYTCIEGIEHLENPYLLVREANRVLRTGGSLVVTTPNVASIRSRLQYLLYGAPHLFDYMTGPAWHINPVSYIELRHILETNGFVVQAVETNGLSKTGSFLHQCLKPLIRSRGRSWVKHNPKAAQVRALLLDEKLLFGDILIVQAVKIGAVHRLIPEGVGAAGEAYG
ncbi:MAG: methyltransferase domain-containing protein [Nitrospiraceae bacterium]